MRLRPLQDCVLIRRVEQEAMTSGGIFIPDTAQEKPTEGEVVAVGPGLRNEAGKLHSRLKSAANHGGGKRGARTCNTHMQSVLRLFSLIALALAVFPANAQTPDPQRGFKAGYVATLSSGEVLPEQMESFRERTKRVLAAMAEKEPGTLMFEFSV